MLSRRGVTDDLKTSPYIVELNYNYDVIDYVFSSKINYNKFKNRYNKERENLSKSLVNRFKINLNSDILSDIRTYLKIEHRGFLIVVNGEVIEWLNTIKLDGKVKILKN